MHKKLDINELNIPTDDIDCWNLYPKHRWVYDLSRLLDVQNIKWSPFETDGLPDKELNIEFETKKTCIRQPGYIYLKLPDNDIIETEVYIIKGEVKHLNHITINSNDIGEVELRINAFVSLYFQKFTGIITVKTISNKIYRISLKPSSDLSTNLDPDMFRLIKKIYN